MLGDTPGFKSTRVLVLSQRLNCADGKRRDTRLMTVPVRDAAQVDELRRFALERYGSGHKGLGIRVCTMTEYMAPAAYYTSYQWIGGMNMLEEKYYAPERTRIPCIDGGACPKGAPCPLWSYRRNECCLP